MFCQAEARGLGGMGGRGAGEAAVVDMSHGAEGYFSDVGQLCQRSE
jgi:hypothetical protein